MSSFGTSQADARLGRVGLIARRGVVPSSHAAPHPGLWATTAVIAAIDGIWLFASGIALEPAGFLIAAAIVGVLLTAAVVWGPVKSEPTLRAMALSTACLIACTVSIALFHYLAATLARPFIDEPLARAEA